jgi:hypothetical protein
MAISEKELGERLDYRAIFGRYVDIPPGRDSVVVRCCIPGHDDTGASLSLDLEEGLWCCHGNCPSNQGTRRGGNIYRFLQIVDGISKADAVTRLAELVGEKVSDVLDEVGLEQRTEQCRLRLWDPDKAAMTGLRSHLMKRRGWNEDTLRKWSIGWDGFRFTFPVKDEHGAVVNIRRYKPDPKEREEKWMSIAKHGQPRLYPIDTVFGSSEIVLVEGETDMVTAQQNGVTAAITSTGGAKSWDPEWNDLFEGKTVYICYDIDDAGKEGARLVGMNLHEIAGAVYDVRLPLDEKDYPGGDVSDFFGSLEGTAEERRAVFYRVLNETRPFIPTGSEDITWAQVKVPFPYEIDEQSVVKNVVKANTTERRRINTAPTWVSGFGWDPEQEQAYFDIVYRSERGIETRLIPRDHVLDRAKLLRQAQYGLPVNSKNATDLSEYYDEFQRANARDLPSIHVSSRNGWRGEDFSQRQTWEDKLFVLGDQAFGMKTGVSQADGEEAVRPFKSRGTASVWMDIMNRAHEASPIGKMYLYAAFAAPLLRPLQVRSGVIHNYGTTRSGKTAFLKLTASVWGNPLSMLNSMNTTQVYIERALNQFSDLPFCLDELQLNPNEDFLNKTIYMIPQEKGRGRGRREGGVHETLTWKSIAMITGEQPLVSSKNLGGQDTRVIEIPGGPSPSEEFSQEMHRTLEQNFGHAGPLFLLRLVRTPLSEIRATMGKFEPMVREAFEGKLVGSTLGLTTLILTAGYYFERWIRGEELSHQQVIDGVLEGFEEVKQRDRYSLRVYEYIRELVLRYRRNFEEPLTERLFDEITEKISPRRKWYLSRNMECFGRLPRVTNEGVIMGEVWFIKSALEKLLEQGGFNYEIMRRECIAEGWLIPGNSTQNIAGTGRHTLKFKWLTDAEMAAA